MTKKFSKNSKKNFPKTNTPFADPKVEQATNIGIVKAKGPYILFANSFKK